MLQIYLVPPFSAVTIKNPIQQQPEFSHRAPLSGTCSFYLGVECVPALHAEKKQGFKIPLKNARNVQRILVSPMGHICTFVANEEPFAVCFTMLCNEALMVIN